MKQNFKKRISTILVIMMVLTNIISFPIPWNMNTAYASEAIASDLFISEYIEGSSNNKANVNSVSTLNQTLVRKSNITKGDIDGSDAFDPSNEWVTYQQDTFTYLGSHTMGGDVSNEPTALSVTHSAITAAVKNQDIKVNFTVSDDDAVTAKVFYKLSSADESGITSADAVKGSGINYSATIQGSSVTENIDYYIEVTNDNKESVRIPETGYNAIKVSESTVHDNIPIANARKEVAGNVVSVEGVVTHAESNTLLYIQDNTGGIKIDTYGMNVDLSSYKEGDLLKVTGKIDVFKNEIEVSVTKASDIELKNSNNALPSPVEITLNKLNDYQGQLVKVKSAQMTGLDNYSFFIKDSTGNISLYYAKAKKFTKADYLVNNYYDVIGVAAMYTNPQLKLRNGLDMTKVDAPVPEVKSEPVFYDLKPANSLTLFNTKPEISINFEQGEKTIDKASAKLLLDGTEITSTISYDETAKIGTAKYTVTTDLSFGEHIVSFAIKDIEGNEYTKVWYFKVIEKNGKFNTYFGIPHAHTSYSGRTRNT